MMATRQGTGRVTFRGSIIQTEKYLWLVAVVGNPILAFLIVDTSWLRLTIFVLVIGLLGRSLQLLLLHISNWFILDDHRQRIVLFLGRSVAFEKVKSIEIRQMANRLDVVTRRGHKRITSRLLVQGLDGREKQHLVEELRKRFPDVTHRITRLPVRGVALMNVVSIPLMCILLFGARHFMFHERPDVYAVPQQSVPEKPQSSTSTVPVQFQSLEERIMVILKDGALPVSIISRLPGQKRVSGQLKLVLKRLVVDRTIAFTIPDKPNSRLQKYRLTDKGRAWLAKEGL